MVKVNLRKAAAVVSKKNKGRFDVSVAQASEIIRDFILYLTNEHSMSEIVEVFERYI